MYATLVLGAVLITFLVAIAIFAGGALSGIADLGLRAMRAMARPQAQKLQAR